MSGERSVGVDGRVRAAENAHCRHFEDELVLLDLSNGQYFALNALATQVWFALLAGKSPIQIATALETQYDVEHDVLVRDCVAFTNDLLQRGLVVPRIG